MPPNPSRIGPGRPRRTDPTIKKGLIINAQVAAAIDHALFNPLHHAPAQGAWSQLVEGLLRDWLARHTSERALGDISQS